MAARIVISTSRSLRPWRPDCRVVYVDNYPIVLVHARALLTGTPQGASAYLDADVRDPGSVLAQAAQTLDLAEPVALMMLAVPQLIPDDANPDQDVTAWCGVARKS